MPARNGRLAARQVVTIGNGQSLSNAISLEDYALVGLMTPAVWTAAAITFAASDSQTGTYNPVYGDDGNEVTIPSAAVVANRVIVNKTVLEQLAGLGWIKIRSGTSGAPVNQAQQSSIFLICKS